MIPHAADAAILLGRILVGALFLGGAAQKTLNPAAAQGLLAGWGLPEALVWPALVFNAVAGAALCLGAWTRPMALALAGYCAATSLFHWLPDDPWQMSIFVKNWAIAGGCLAIFAHGAGRFALHPDR